MYASKHDIGIIYLIYLLSQCYNFLNIKSKATLTKSGEKEQACLMPI